MKVALFGCGGQLGQSLAAVMRGAGMEVQAYGRGDADLADGAKVRATLLHLQPRIIINAAAYTAVDRAESDAAAATRINADAPGIMALAARELGALFVHYSTDYVFDGAAREPYDEDAPTAPLGVYGATKLAGENAVRSSGAAHLIVRTSWLYSNHGHNFLRTMLRLADERDELQVVDDQFGSPTYARLVAAATVRMLDAMADGAGWRIPLGGLYHMTCQGAVSWHGFAQRIMELSGRAARVRVTPISSAGYRAAARRPAYSVLSCDRLERCFGIRLPHWESALMECLERARGLA